jgi:5-methylcytosine-specific restriction endonuclease McrA
MGLVDDLRRHTYLLSLLGDTNTFLTERSLHLIHADSSFLLFDPRLPNPWLRDLDQFMWLLLNHNQAMDHGRPFISRIFLFPSDTHRTTEEARLFRAMVSSVLHVQLYEGIRVGVYFGPARDQLSGRFDFSYMTFAGQRVTWPAWAYYAANQPAEARRGTSSQDRQLDQLIAMALPDVIWLERYRDEHFERGRRMALPVNWRRLLLLLHRGVCAACGQAVGNLAEIDHMRPLKPEESPFHRVAAGNSILFNLCLLCRECNRRKATRFVRAPEEDIPQLVWDRRIQLYFRISLSAPPRRAIHELPPTPLPFGEELVVI